MMLFQSLGGQYTYSQAIKHLYTHASRRARQDVISRLEQQFDARAYLYYKGRSGLSEGVRIATGGSGVVLVNGLTCYSVIEAIHAAGCEARYVDVDPDTLNFDIDLVKQAVSTGEVRAIIVQNTLGIMADIEAIRDAVGKKVVLIEDLAHSYGLTYKNGMLAGTASDIVMLSFGRDKAIDIGNGGALLLRGKFKEAELMQPEGRPALVDRLRDRLYPIITWHARALYGISIGKIIIRSAFALGLVVRSADGDVDLKTTISNAQAVWLSRALDRHEEILAGRENVLRMYAPLAHLAPRGAQQIRDLLRVPIVVDDRSAVLASLANKGLYCNDTWYDVPVIPSRRYADAGYDEAVMPESVRLARHLINLPLHAGVRREHVIDMVKILGDKHEA